MPKKAPELAGKPLSGALAKPIDLVMVGLHDAIHGAEAVQKYNERKGRELYAARKAKIDDLARHFDIDPDRFQIAMGRELLLELTLMALANATVIGFQQKKEGKWPRSKLFWIMQAVDIMKREGKYSKDLDACAAYLKIEKPDLAKRSAKAELMAEARQLQNRITNMRSAFEKGKIAFEKQLHKNTPLKIVKH